MSERWYLTAKRGRKKGVSWEVTPTPLIIGRSEECDVVVRDSLVSRAHCRILADGDTVICEDLGSSNATLVNGKPVARRELKLADELSIGRAIFLLTKTSSSNAGTSTPFAKKTTAKIVDSLNKDCGPARLLETLRPTPRHVADLAALHELARDINSSTDLDAIARNIIEYVTRYSPVSDYCWVQHAGTKDGLSIQTNEGPLSDILEQECKVFLNDHECAPRIFRVSAEGLERDVCVLPADAHGQTAAALGLGFPADAGIDLESEIGFALCLIQTAAPFLLLPQSGGLSNAAALIEEPIEDFGVPLIGSSCEMRQLRRMIGIAAKAEFPVLIQGETGTGKELVANLLHRQSSRSEKPLVSVNCATIQGTLFESEVFGYKRGAFTGAMRDKLGYFSEVDGGALFLDEVGELDQSNQARLLRAIESGVFRPVGGTKDEYVDVWILAATNRNLIEAVHRGDFRSDLYYRLCGIQIDVPPLRSRQEDIPDLIEFFANQFVAERGGRLNSIASDTKSLLSELHWPGNVRELRNVVQRILAMNSSGEVSIEDVIRLTGNQPADSPATETKMEAVEREHIRRVLDECGGHIGRAAERLGVHRNTMTSKLRKYGLKP